MKHPYAGLPDRQFWKKDPGIEDPALLDPVSDVPFKIQQSDKIVTAGSCFAQHVARHMSKSGFNHFITERAHPIIRPAVARKLNYGMFSARYGNVYTARQLLQLLQRAYGQFTPMVQSWRAPRGTGVVDPFRPQIQPGGYLSAAELEVDREQHLRAVRRAIEQMDIFVFTLGLTEGWADRRDGAVYPIAPGVAGGTYDPETVQFVNFDEAETYADLHAALSFIRAKNPKVKIILTVSPVPLNATYEPRHVLVSTTWSKAVLRIAAEKATKTLKDCAYFPSYEIITSPHARGRYYAPDRREITERGVTHVMTLFKKHFTDSEVAPVPRPKRPVNEARRHMQEMQRKIDVLCDEAAINNES
ncbi:MAG: GSCFA domain-containing protein [Paenirhodobacter sp.]|uniref:GSCFA domain-containing protein n=1 Tax=Paenirhodobacter sp. TaxID=1965326 RepID=UPI003D118817